MGHICDPAFWAKNEFGGVHLGDLRRTSRLVQIAEGAAKAVGSALSCVCGKSGAQAVSRLFGRDETTLDAVTECHVMQTRDRCADRSRILAVQDTTVLDFSAHSATKGIGFVTTSEKTRGLLMHSVLAVSSDGIPLGIMGLQVWAREDTNRGCAKSRRKRVICEKESNKWLVGLTQAQNVVPDNCELVVIGDRESDIYALFAQDRGSKVHLLVRFAHNRAIQDDDHKYILEALETLPLLGNYKVEVPRQPGKVGREALLELSAGSVLLRPPRNRTPDVANRPVRVWLVKAVEVNVPDGMDGISWVLITTEAVASLDGAVRSVREYAARWIIEEFHRVLKSGCRVEQMQFDSATKLKPAVGVLAVVAWRVLYLTKLARAEPEMDVGLIADPDEVNVLSQWLKSQGERNSNIRSVREFTIVLARLGGFIGRKSDGMPGTKTIWQGLRAIEILVLGYKLAAQYKM